MKKYLALAFVLFLIVGCGGKNTMLNLGEHITYPKSTNSEIRQISIEEITDSRENKNYVATVKDKDGIDKDYVLINTELSTWFNNALIKELKSRNINVSNDAQTKVSLNITKFMGSLQGLSKENLTANGEIFVKIKKGNKTITKRIAQSQSNFTPLIRASAFDPFLKDILRDLIIKTADEISSSL